MTTSNKPTFVFFYSNYSQQCEDFMLDWVQVVRLVKSKYNINTMKINGAIINEMVPTFVYYPNGDLSGIHIIYKGTRNVDNIVSFVDKHYNFFKEETMLSKDYSSIQEKQKEKKITLKDKVVMWNNKYEENEKDNLQTFFDNIHNDIEDCIRNAAQNGKHKAKFYFPIDKGGLDIDKLTELQCNKAKIIAICFLNQEGMKFRVEGDEKREYADIIW